MTQRVGLFIGLATALLAACTLNVNSSSARPSTATPATSTTHSTPSVCEADQAALEGVAWRYEAIHGDFPASIQQMIDAGQLDPARLDSVAKHWIYIHTPGESIFGFSPVPGGPCDPRSP